VVESLNVSDDIKTAGPRRDEHIQNYIKSIEVLGKNGVKVICYNFMPVFDWLRTDFSHRLPDGSTAMFFDKSKVDHITPEALVKDMTSIKLPGWEPERLAKLSELVKTYKGISRDDAFANFKYFIDAIIGTCEKYDVKMAVHTDDPPWDIFGWPRIVSSIDDYEKITNLNLSIYNGFTLCTGSFSAAPQNDVVPVIEQFHERIHFMHVRNIKHLGGGNFTEVSHRAADGDVDIVKVLDMLVEYGYQGYIRPDHGRHLWSEVGEDGSLRVRPGYGLYDRALGIMYINGVLDALTEQQL
jgi:mannonate dehydratase